MKTTIIAEIGVNHNGNLTTAKKMIETAIECGADVVKFQTFIPQNIVSKYSQKAEYQKRNTNNYESQLNMLKSLALTFDEFTILNDYCNKLGTTFLSTPFDIESINFLNKLGIPFWKIPSGEITNLPYLITIAQTHKPIIMSTGMCTIEEIRDAIDVLRLYGSDRITLLHCTTEYPAPYADVNLKAMITLKNLFKIDVGYSDHTEGISIPVAAVSLGACIIEKHFTLDKNAEGPDHKASLNPIEFKEMVYAIRNVEAALGDGLKRPMISEQKNIMIARKSIVAKKNIKIGEIFTEDNITVKRPGNGISPMKWFDVLGKTAIKNFTEDELIIL